MRIKSLSTIDFRVLQSPCAAPTSGGRLPRVGTLPE